MNDDNDFEPRGKHPDQAMGAYVDGSATAQERRDVETHLADCARCRREAELAGMARAALASLPELDPPRLRVPGTEEGRDSEPGSMVRLHGRERRSAWQRAAWGLAGVGAAAAVIAAFVVIGGNLASHTATTSSLDSGGAQPVAPAATRGPALEQTHTDYSPAELNALAVQAASNTAQFASASPPSPVESAGGKDGVAAVDVHVACVAEAAGASPDHVVRVELARFEGKPAWIGTLIVGGAGSPRVLVVAARPAILGPCTALYQTTAPVPAP